MGPRPAWQPMSPADRSTRLLWEVCADCRRRSIRHHLRPGDWLVTWYSLLLVHIRLDQARIDRECFTADQPSRDAHRHYALKHPPQSITLSKALVPRAAEHRMIVDCVLDAEFAKPPVRQIDLRLSTNPPL